MFGSQGLEVLIGLSLMFFVIALLASAVSEVVSQAMQKRAADLENALKQLMGDHPSSSDVPRLYETPTVASLRRTTGKSPSYLSAKAFGDAVLEMMIAARRGAADLNAMVAKLPEGLRDRLEPVLADATADLNDLKATAEGWFDESMDRLEGIYKRWAQKLLFVIGLFLAVLANASAYGVASELWNDPVTRAAVTETASNIGAGEQPAAPDTLKEVAREIDDLDETGLPVGWDGLEKRSPSAIKDFLDSQPGGIFGSIVGWLATAVLVMLGAPFWFDLLSRFVSLRGSGARPPRAEDDPRSATRERSAVAASGQVPMLNVFGGGPAPADTNGGIFDQLEELQLPSTS